MKDIQIREIERTAKLLHGMGCQFKIITPDGEQYGELPIAPQEKSNRCLYGAMAAFYKEKLNLLAEVGDVQEVPIGAFSVAKLQASMHTFLTKQWGKGNVVTHRNGSVIEVMRAA